MRVAFIVIALAGTMLSGCDGCSETAFVQKNVVAEKQQPWAAESASPAASPLAPDTGPLTVQAEHDGAA